jgi:hypothetical protein
VKWCDFEFASINPLVTALAWRLYYGRLSPRGKILISSAMRQEICHFALNIDGWNVQIGPFHGWSV